jgi:hypothetical protein
MIVLWRESRLSPESFQEPPRNRGSESRAALFVGLWRPKARDLAVDVSVPEHIVERSHMNLRWGILGCARISRRGLIPGIQASKTGRLVALASRNPATARAWCDEFKILKSHETYQGLLEDPDAIMEAARS